MMHINRYKKYFFFLLLFPVVAAAQGGDYDGDQKFLHFGFSLGYATADFGIKESAVPIDGTVYHVDVSSLKPGFSVGIIGDLSVTRYLDLRVTPTLQFLERELSYKPEGGTDADIKRVTVGSVPVYLPVYLKYSAERYDSYRPYLIAGGGLYYDLGRDKEKPIYLNAFDVYAEFGVGCDIYYTYFKFAPELKLAIGANDMFVPLDKRDTGTLSEADKLFSIALSKLTSRLLTLTFNFE